MFKQPEFDELDLAEIYYAIQEKLSGPTIREGDETFVVVVLRQQQRLREIMDKILDSGANI